MITDSVKYHSTRSGISILNGILFFITVFPFLLIILPPNLMRVIINPINFNNLLVIAFVFTALVLNILKNNTIQVVGKSFVKIFIILFFFYITKAIIDEGLEYPPVTGLIKAFLLSGIFYLFLTNIKTNYTDKLKISNNIQLMVITATTITAIIGIFQIFVLTGGGLPENPGLFYVKNHFGFFIAIGFAMIFSRLADHSSGEKKVWMLLTFIHVIAALLSATRGAWLSILIILIMVLLYYDRKKYLYIPILFTLFILIFFNQRLFDTTYLGDISTGRFLLWTNLAGQILTVKDFILGLGVGFTFGFSSMQLVGIPGFTAAENPFIYVHNDFFYFLIETGITGCMLFIIFYIVIIKNIRSVLHKYKNKMNDTENKVLLSVYSTLVPILIMHMTDTALFATGMMVYLFVILSTAYIIIDTKLNSAFS